MYCKNCGNEIEDNVSFCPNCGAKVERDTQYPKKGKSQIGAGLLGIFLGSLGIHNFYLGYMTKGIIQLLLTLIGWMLFGLGPLISGIWAFIEAIMIFMGKIPDAEGNPLS